MENRSPEKITARTLLKPNAEKNDTD